MKYVDVELKAEIRRIVEEETPISKGSDYYHGVVDTADKLLSFITTRQQEQPNTPKGKFNFPKFLYARTLDNKTIDISYAPQNMDAIEYVRNDFIEHEQPEVELEKEIDSEWKKCEPTDEGMGLESANIVNEQFDYIARHFYELGLNARKK